MLLFKQKLDINALLPDRNKEEKANRRWPFQLGSAISTHTANKPLLKAVDEGPGQRLVGPSCDLGIF